MRPTDCDQRRLSAGLKNAGRKLGSPVPERVVHRAGGRIRTAEFCLERAQAIGEEMQLMLGRHAHAAVELVQIDRASRCCTAWNDPTGRPNTIRSFTC